MGPSSMVTNTTTSYVKMDLRTGKTIKKYQKTPVKIPPKTVTPPKRIEESKHSDKMKEFVENEIENGLDLVEVNEVELPVEKPSSHTPSMSS